MSWLTRLRNVFRSDKVSNEIDRELTFHPAERTDDLVAGGMSRAAARREARRRFGNYTLQKEDTRERNLLVWLDTPGATCGKAPCAAPQPDLAVVALLTLAIGIGANTAVFTVVNSVLLKPLPYPNSDELVAVWNRAPGAPGLADVPGGLRCRCRCTSPMRKRTGTFEHIGAWSPGTANVTGLREPEQVRTVLVTDGTPQAFAVPPRLAAGCRVRTRSRRRRNRHLDLQLLAAGIWRRARCRRSNHHDRQHAAPDRRRHATRLQGRRR
jgi:hypothetical protein